MPDTHPAPAEGLPPCMSVVMFDGRGASVRASADCTGKHMGSRFWIVSGQITPCDCSDGVHRGAHPEITWHYDPPFGPGMMTDDLDEAQAAFERGAEYVRTGEMPC